MLLNATRQISFYESLLNARKTKLSDKLKEILGLVNLKTVTDDIHSMVSNEVLSILANAGIRDEYVFPSPLIIKAAPSLVGYYRLLLGLPQKTYYSPALGMSRFKNLENNNVNNLKDEDIVQWCQDMIHALSELILEISSTLEPRDINDLQILTLGQQIQGGRNNTIGSSAATKVFQSITLLCEGHISDRNERSITIAAEKGTFEIVMSSDPDITIKTLSGDQRLPIIAIEIKGGEDGSNVHNRAGEAEKSHLKTKASLGFDTCWTIISSANHSIERLKSESPSTDEWFDVLQIIAREGDSCDSFSSKFSNLLGLNLV